jgi:hypothetical protein
MTYRRLGNIAILNHAQLLFDVIVVTVLVYYSGGVHSWFYAMYALFVLEAAFILPRVRDTWIVAGFSAIAYGVVLGGEYFGILPHVEMPFIDGDLHLSRTYVIGPLSVAGHRPRRRRDGGHPDDLDGEDTREGDRRIDDRRRQDRPLRPQVLPPCAFERAASGRTGRASAMGVDGRHRLVRALQPALRDSGRRPHDRIGRRGAHPCLRRVRANAGIHDQRPCAVRRRRVRGPACRGLFGRLALPGRRRAHRRVGAHGGRRTAPRRGGGHCQHRRLRPIRRTGLPPTRCSPQPTRRFTRLLRAEATGSCLAGADT